MRIGILASGGLGYKVLSDLIKQIEKPVFIASDSNSEYIIEFAKQNSVQLFTGNPRDGKLVEFLKKYQIEADLILSINYLFLLDEELIDSLALAINVHGSILPKYRGRTPHVWSIINGEAQTGVTAHIIDTDCDTGDIVEQLVIPIEKDDTGATILKKYEKIYPELLLSVLEEIQSEQLKRVKQDDSKATYFGKRTPDDGLINWNWHKERIRNWVRAQAHPYPGAFSLLNGEKVIIDEVNYSDVGFSDTIKNGTILEIKENPIIKCPNGAIELTQVRNQDILEKFKSKMVLNQ
ncbi:methionyl-tRNA formyltransferase [Gracilimonas sp. Q87]|uniref:methionyl-tRNA formyltransferase n=1 Tax=Gracilimonas sp. Q87 TaxID=3384766 RepID=UPI0039840F85